MTDRNAYSRAYYHRTKDKRKAKIDKARKAYSAKNKEKLRTWHRDWMKSNRSKIRAYQMQKDYGLSIEQFDALLTSQSGKCAICKRLFINLRNEIDHDHVTGLVRGILCQKCNTLLGMSNDSPEILLNAVSYLRR